MADPQPGQPEEPLTTAEVRSGVIALFLLVAIFHGPSLHNQFTYDDSWTLVGNPFIRRPANLLELLGPGPSRDNVPDAGRPTLLATEILDFKLWGLMAAGYHLQNVIWHFGVSALAFVLLARLTRRFLLALAATGLFAVHPLFVEVVSVINYREDLLAAFFLLLSFGLVVRGRSSPRRRWWFRAGAALSLTVGNLAKENAAVAPILLALVDVCVSPEPSRRVLRRHAADYLSLAAAAVAVFAWRWATIGGPAIVSQTAAIPKEHLERAPTMLRAAWAFLKGIGQLVLPIGLSPEYADGVATGSSIAPGIASVVVLAGGATAAWRFRRAQPWIALAVLGGLAAYLPTSGIVPITNLRADRYMYLPGIPFCLGLAVLVLAALRRVTWLNGPFLLDVPRAWAALGALLVLLGALTLRQTRIWHDDLDLWTTATERAPRSARGWTALAEAKLRAGRSLEALAAVNESLRLAPDRGDSRELLGIIYMEQGDNAAAHVELLAALRLGVHNHPELLNNLGHCEILLKRYDEALGHLEKAASSSPRYDRPLINAARARNEMGDRPAAIATLRRLLVRVPESIDGWKQLAALLELEGDKAGAIEAFEEAAHLLPGDRQVLQGLRRLGRKVGPGSGSAARGQGG